MSVFRANPGALDDLTSQVLGRSAAAAAPASAGAQVLIAHGYATSAAGVHGQLASLGAWAAAWAESLRQRVGLLTDETGIPTPTSVADRAEWLIERSRRLYISTPVAGTLAGGAGELASALLDALEAADLQVVGDLLDRMQELSERDIVAFFEALGPDMTGLLPALLVDAGVSDGDLSRYLGPLGAGLGVASMAGDGIALSFTGAEMMAGHEGAPVSPAVYFDFGRFAPDFVIAATGGALAEYAQAELPLRSPEYRRPDGSIAEVDPRLPLIRAVLAMDLADQVMFIRATEGAGATRGLIAPATEWADGGAAVGQLLARLGTVQDPNSVDVVVLTMRTIAGAERLSPGVTLGAAAMIAPHLPSLALATWFGGPVDIAQTPLRPALQDEGDAEWLVQSFMAAVLRNVEARNVVDGAFAVLLAATISAHFDPDDTESLAGVADDLGVLWRLIFGSELQADLDAGRMLDQENERMGSVVANATNLVVAGTGLTIATTGFAAWMAEQAAGLLDVADSVETMLGGTSHAEAALLAGFATQRSSMIWVAVVLAAEMHHRGMLDLPGELLDPDLDAAGVDESTRELLVSTLVEAGVDIEAWFNDVFAIIAYGVPTPR